MTPQPHASCVSAIFLGRLELSHGEDTEELGHEDHYKAKNGKSPCLLRKCASPLPAETETAEETEKSINTGATEETGETGHDLVVIKIENFRCPVSTVIPV